MLAYLLALLAIAAVGVEAGWRPLPGGGHEYTIQIEPGLLKSLADVDIVGEVPAQIDVRRYRITLGEGKLARVDGPSRDTVAKNTPSGEVETREFPDRVVQMPQAVETSADSSAQAMAGISEQHQTSKPSLPDEEPRWLPLLVTAVLLACSLGANIYLAWIAWEARTRYRETLSRLRPSTGRS